ncbi:MAG: hypothetical protein V7635_1477, partial [Arthrobacter sp.]
MTTRPQRTCVTTGGDRRQAPALRGLDGGQLPPEGAPVRLGAGVQRLGEVVPQQDRVAESGFPGDFVDIE